MTYGFASGTYQIPAPEYGDILEDSSEVRKARIIDNNLYGSIKMHSGGNGVISEGIYAGTFQTNDSYVTLSALEAFIDQIYIDTNTVRTWTGLADNTLYYLYAQLVETGSDSSREFKHYQVFKNTSGVLPAESILLATATTTAIDITLDTNPSGKIYILTLEEHMAVSTDPHGATLNQTAMNVSGLSVLGLSSFADDISMTAGKTIDGVDPSSLAVLVDGVNADAYHSHASLSGLEIKTFGLSPEYGVESGTSGMVSGWDGVHNYYQNPATLPGTNVFTQVIRVEIPADFNHWDPTDAIVLSSKVDAAVAGTSVSIFTKDTADVNDVSSLGLQNLTWIEDSLSSLAGTYTPGEFMTILLAVSSASGNPSYIGELSFKYHTF